LLYASIAILIWPSLVGLNYLFRDRRETGVAAVQKIQLSSLRSELGSAFYMDKNLDGLIVLNCPDINPGDEYTLEVIDSTGVPLFRNRHFSDFDMFKNAEIVFPSNMMRPGKYSVIISSETPDSLIPLYRYEFQIK